jgi:hypothetical protein
MTSIGPSKPVLVELFVIRAVSFVVIELLLFHAVVCANFG